MRLSYALELILVVGISLGLTRYRLSDSDHAEAFSNLQWIVRFKDGIDTFYAGVAIVGSVGLLVESVRGRSPKTWGPGRWVWSFVALYLLFRQIDPICGTVSRHIWAVGMNSNSLISDLIYNVFCNNDWFLLTSAAWMLMAMWLTSLFARSPRELNPDGREWAGRVFALLLILTTFSLKALILLGHQEESMGGGL